MADHTGRASLPTPDGTYLSVEKANPVRMIGGGPAGSAGHYDELVNFAVRFTYSATTTTRPRGRW